MFMPTRRMLATLFGSTLGEVQRVSGAETPAATSVPSEISPESFGGDALGAADNTVALSKLVSAVGPLARVRKALHGTSRITRTVTIPPSTVGGQLSGDGVQSFDQSSRGSRPGSHSVVVWDGEPGGTMFRADGVLLFDFDHLSFVGRTKVQNANRAGSFWKSVYVPRAGAGLNSFRTCSWEDFDKVFLLGEGGTVGAADILWQKCAVQGVDTFLETTNHNCVNFAFEQFSPNWVRTVAKLKPGGSLSVHMLNAVGCGGDGPDDWVFDILTDDGNGWLLFDGIRLEQGTRHFLRATGKNQIALRGLDEAQGNIRKTLFRCEGANLAITDSRLASHDRSTPCIMLASGPGGRDGALILERVHFDADTWDLDEWVQWADANQRCHLTIRDCTYGRRKEPLPFINNRIESGRVRVIGRTSGTSAARLSLNGRSVGDGYSRPEIPARWAGCVDAYISARNAEGSAFAAMHRRFEMQRDAIGRLFLGPPQPIGRDYNPGSYPAPVFMANDARKTIEATATGVPGATIDWTVEYDCHGNVSPA